MKIIRHNMNTSIFIWLINSLSLIQVFFHSHWTSELYWGTKQFHSYQSPDCLFHIFIPKAIDKRVQHRNHDSKKHSGYFDEEPWAFGVGYTIKEQDSPMENGGSAQVGGTGGEGFLEFTSWRHLDDCENYENIGGEYNQEAAHTSLSVEMMKHVSWLKWVSEQEGETVQNTHSQSDIWC